MAYITSNEYKQIIYSGDARHKLKIWFNGNELVNADNYCEKIIRYPRILPQDGSKRFSLDNFVSQQITIILHDINVNIIQDQVEISIGTLISENNYEYVPLGIFNIQGNPKTDKNKITITLRDNRTKFDVGYNAKPLIDAGGGKATKKQILNDICEKAGVISDVTSFLGENDDIGIYDNSITGTIYVSYIAEQAGRIPIIKRNGHLDFINLKELTVIKIPLYLVEKYEIGDNYSIQRVVYESGIIKYETSNDETLDTLFINSANPYIQNQEHINNILQNVNGFEIDSVKTGEIMGDPAIDPYDLIQIYGYYDENNHFVDDENVVVFTTLANHTMTYTGKIINVYDTQIGLEERKNNVTISGEATYRKYAKTEYDAMNAEITLLAGETINEDNPNSLINKQSKLTVRVDAIEGELSNVTGMTQTKDSQLASVAFTDTIPQSEPTTIKIYPISQSISYDYPHNDYPQNDYSKTRTIRFHNNTTNENIDYILPDDLLFYDSDHYDEFYLDLKSQTCQVTKRCKYNADATVSLLATESIISYPYEHIALTEGIYTVSILSYNSGYILVTLMAKNIYTDQFYTRLETDTIISQTAESITTEANTKFARLDGKVDENSSKITQNSNSITSEVTRATREENALSSRISQTATGISLSVNNGSTTSGITIGIVKEDGTTETKSGTIQMSGLVSFSNLKTSGQTEINGANITTGKISAERLELSNYLTVTSASNTYASKSSLSAGTTTISGGCITTGTIDASKVTVKNINASNISSGTIDASTITVKNIDASKITTGTINGNVINITNINASNIKSGNIQSTNYVSGSRGTKISLSDGSIDTKNFKLNNTGTITIYDTGGSLASNANIQILSTVSGGNQSTIFKSTGVAHFYNINNPDDNRISISTIFGYPEMQLIKGNYSGSLSNEELLFIKSQSGSSDVTTTIRASGIVTPSVTQTSLETQKKNFEKFENGIEVIKNIDIYKYNLISENNNDKKHIGFVIGDKFNYSKEITSKNNDGVDLYSMISVVLQAVKEQQQQIEKLEGLING